jgi:hypothetical protein
LIPDGDDTTQFATTLNGSKSTHYEEVNVLEALRATDGVADSTSGNRDIFTFNDPTDDFDEIFGVIGWTHADYSSSSEIYRMVCSSNGTETESANIAADSDWFIDPYVVELDPDTGNAWTNSSINAIKFGFEVQ